MQHLVVISFALLDFFQFLIQNDDNESNAIYFYCVIFSMHFLLNIGYLGSFYVLLLPITKFDTSQGCGGLKIPQQLAIVEDGRGVSLFF